MEHHREIFRLARSLTRSGADAEDLAQTAVVARCSRAPSSRAADQAKWYVMRIVRNLAIDQARARRAVEPWAEVPERMSSEPAPDEVLDPGAVDDRVPRAAFADLPEAHREACGSASSTSWPTRTSPRASTPLPMGPANAMRAMQALRSTIGDRRYRPTN